MSFGTKIRELRDEKGFSQERMAELLQPFLKNYTLGKGTISNWEKKMEPPGIDVVDAYAAVFKVKKAYLFGLNTEGKGTSVEESTHQPYNGGKLIPFYDAITVGGNDLLADQSPVSMPIRMINPGTFFRNAEGAVQITGHSMFPKYPSGCIVAYKIASLTLIIWGEDYVIELADRRILKRVEKGEKGYIKAVSYNVNKDNKYVYDPIDIPITDVKRMFMVLGKIELEAMQL